MDAQAEFSGSNGESVAPSNVESNEQDRAGHWTHAQLFVLAHPWSPVEDAEYLSERYDGVIPFCLTCADWHESDEGHSNVENETYVSPAPYVAADGVEFTTREDSGEADPDDVIVRVEA